MDAMPLPTPAVNATMAAAATSLRYARHSNEPRATLSPALSSAAWNGSGFPMVSSNADISGSAAMKNRRSSGGMPTPTKYRNAANWPKMPSRPATGHRFMHHLRYSTSSTASAAGNTTTEAVICLSTIRCHRDPTVPNVSPMGHTRQNSGRPATMAHTSTAASVHVRLSRARNARLAFTSSAAFAPEQAAQLDAHAPGFAGLGSRLKKRLMTGAGQPHAHHARPNTRANSSSTPAEMAATGMNAFDANMASRPPSGHSRLNCPMPNDDGVPMPQSKASEASTATSTAASVKRRANTMRLPWTRPRPCAPRFDSLPIYATPPPASCFSVATRMPRSSPPVNDVLTLAGQMRTHSPQPLHFASSTCGRRSSSNVSAP